MHNPEVVVFDLHVPIPHWWAAYKNEPRWGVRRRRYTNDNKPIYPWWRPAAWIVCAAGCHGRWYTVVTVWHNEPGGADSGAVCKGMGGSELTWHNLVWAVRHWCHISFQVHPVQQVKHYFDRCDECHQRMRRSTRIGVSWYGAAVVHEWCFTSRQRKRELDDLTALHTGDADWTTAWRANRRLAALREPGGES